MTEQNLTKLTINTLTKSQYQALYNSGDISYTEIYLITDDNGTGVYALANNVYTKEEIDDIIANLPSGGGGSGTGVDLSDYYTKSEITALLANKANTSDLSDYVEIADLANVATSGDYNDLSNAPTIPSKTSDLTNDSGYVSSSSLSTVATSGSYNDLSNKPDLSVYQTIANAFSGSYNDLTDKPTIPTIPTNISTFTNDSGYQTASNVNTAIATALTGYATESYVQTAVQNLGNVFTIKGSVSTVANLPSSNNTIGDVYYVAEKQAGYIWIEIDNVAQWEELGETIDLSNYVQTSDLTWNNISSKPTFATVATTGDYDDLTNKPTIPVVPTNVSSFTNDAGYITSSALTGYATKSYVTSQLTNYVTTDTTQNITGVKTIYNTSNGHSDIYFKAPSNDSISNTMGFSAFDASNRQIGGLQIMNRTLQFNSDASSTYYYGTFLTNFRNDSNALNTVTGFRVLPSDAYSGSYSINFVAPFGTQTDLYDIYKSNSNVNTVNLVAAITDGTNTVLANKLGVVDISSLVSGGGSSTSGSVVTGTNDGTNWTSLTINGATYNIPAGGSSSGGSSSAPSNMVTTDTDQSITGVKTFVGQQKLKFKCSSSSDILGFTAYDNNDNEIGNLQVANRTVRGSSYTYVTLGNWSDKPIKSKVGFRLQPNSSSNSFNFVMPYGTYSDFNANTYATNADITIPCAFTDGTTTIKANASGLVDLSTLNLGGGSYTAGNGIDITNDTISIDNTVALKSEIPTVPTNVSAFTNDAGYITGITSTDVTTALGYTPGTSNFSGSYNDLTNKPTIPDAVSGTNDGTNWTSLTIGSDTYGLASGSTPSNMVTTDTTQTITGTKTFQGTNYTTKINDTYNGISVSDSTNTTTIAIGDNISFNNSSAYSNKMAMNADTMIISNYSSTPNYYVTLLGTYGATVGQYTFKNKTGDVAITSEIPTTASSTSTSTFTPTTETLTFTYSDNTTATITIVTAATVSTTTTTTLS